MKLEEEKKQEKAIERKGLNKALKQEEAEKKALLNDEELEKVSGGKKGFQTGREKVELM